MKVLDRYIIRELALPIIFCSMTLVFLILIADLFDNLDELLKNKTAFSVIAKYYLSLIPNGFTETISWAAWVGTLFLLVNFGFHSETIAMKAAGLKITTIVRPILFLGFLIGILTFLINDRIVPHTSRIASELRDVHIEKKKSEDDDKVYRNVTYYSGKDQLYYFRSFYRGKNEVEGVVALWFSQNEHSTRKKMVARKGKWTGSGWEFEGINEYQMDSRGRILGEPQTFMKKTYSQLAFTPKDLASASSETSYLSYRELKRSIKKLKENGVAVDSESVDLQYRLASPWQALIMMMIAIPLLARTTNRKLIAVNVLICIVIIFGFHVLGAVGVALGKAGKIFPFLSAWTGNIIFGVAALLNLEKANY
jgi:lipopolysaccharide export system permease protein